MRALLRLAQVRVVCTVGARVVCGGTVITILATVVTMFVLVGTVGVVLQCSRRLTTPRPPGEAGPPPAKIR